VEAMDNIDIQREAEHMLAEWNALKLEDDQAVKLFEALQETFDPSALGNQIQRIYETSSQMWLPIEECIDTARKLIVLKLAALLKSK